MTLTQHIKENLDLNALVDAVRQGRLNITQIIEIACRRWQSEMIASQWYKDNRRNIGLMLETIEANKRDAIAFLKGETTR